MKKRPQLKLKQKKTQEAGNSFYICDDLLQFIQHFRWFQTGAHFYLNYMKNSFQQKEMEFQRPENPFKIDEHVQYSTQMRQFLTHALGRFFEIGF